MKPIPLHRVAVVQPFTNFLAAVGAPFQRAFRQAGLPVCALEDANNFIPSHRFWRFLVDMAYSQDIPDLGFRVGQSFGANCADPNLIDLLRRSPTLYQGLLRASALINETVSHCQVGIYQPPHSQFAYFYHSPSCDTRNPVIEQLGWYGILPFIGMVREFAGRKWLPGEIGVMTCKAPGPHIREQFQDTRIRLSQPHSYITLENALLSLPPLDDKSAAPENQTWHHDEFSTDFANSFKQLLHAYVLEEDLNLEHAAELCDLSKRALQRKLAAQGTSYSRVLDEARFDAAKRMLQDPNKKVTDISQLLGYSDATHFSRAFRRISGITPNVYRQLHHH